MEVEFASIEEKWQKKWADAKLFEPEVDTSKEKFFFTTPYPYISGSLHIGHGRAVTESDIYCRYVRMKGKNLLYPLAFHITGTPVLGISSAIEKGDKKKIQLYTNYVKSYVKDKKEIDKTVQSFKDPWKIVDFFVPKMMEEYSSLGLSVDWTRRFTTGDKDYQKFIEWQFNQYKEKNYLIKGSYHVLFCPNCNNAVGEDDIQDADTNPVSKQDFIWSKFHMRDSDLILMAGTTRPDALYGQTNLWVDPKGDYVIVQVKDEKWVVGREAAKKIDQQYVKSKIIGTISPKELIGKWVQGPIVDREIHILPAWFIKSSVGSGIVYSALEDPVDLFELKKIQSNDKLIKENGLDEKETKRLKPIAIIKVPGMGDNLGEDIGKEFGVKSDKDVENLEIAKGELNRRVFRKGVMKDICGKCAGMSVQDAQVYLKKSLVESGDSIMFYETSREAFCRCGEKVVVSVLNDQWFLDFNAKGWKKLAHECLKGLTLPSPAVRKMFVDTFEWLDKRPTARKRGIGTPLPFDKDWIIESLSDSTIYMTFYTIKNLINKYKIKSNQLTLSFFDYVYLEKGDLKKVSKETGIEASVLKDLRKNFDYWYPNDHRHTFVAHMSNHLSFFIFAHAGIFPKKYWPKRISLHGFVISDGVKMSKSKGNVVSLLEVKDNFGADTFRAYISTSTNLEGVFDWNPDEARNVQKNLFRTVNAVLEAISERKKGELTSTGKTFISKFESAIRNMGVALNEMRLRDYGQIVLYKIPNDIKKLKSLSSKEEVAAVYNLIVERWIKSLAPVVPHIAEELWERIGNKEFISNAEWPKYNETLIDASLEKIEEVISNVRLDILKIKELAKLEKVSKVKMFVSPDWKWKALAMIKDACDGKPDFGLAMKTLMANDEMKAHGKEVQPFLKAVMNRFGELQDLEKFDEVAVLTEAKIALAKEFGEIEIVKAESSSEAKAKNAFPGKPALLVE